MVDKMTDAEFAQKCEWEGLEYAVTEYGLSAEHLQPDSILREAMEAVDLIKDQWVYAITDLETALEEVDLSDDETVH